MRKRKETQKRGLSSAQATTDEAQRVKSAKDNVAEQQEEEQLLHAIGELLHGKRVDEVISIGMSIVLDGVLQKSHKNPLLAIQLFKQVVEAMGEAFFNLTLKQCIDE